MPVFERIAKFGSRRRSVSEREEAAPPPPPPPRKSFLASSISWLNLGSKPEKENALGSKEEAGGKAGATAGERPFVALEHFFETDLEQAGVYGGGRLGLAHWLTDWTDLRSQLVALKESRSIGTHVLLLVRHGEGHHNVAKRDFGMSAWDEEGRRSEALFDSRLTEHGHLQVGEGGFGGWVTRTE